MPIDARLPLAIDTAPVVRQSPIDLYGRVLGVQQQRQQMAGNEQILADKAAAAERAARVEAQAVRDQGNADKYATILAESGGDNTKALGRIRKELPAKFFLEFQKYNQDRDKEDAEIDAKSYPERKERMTRLGGLALQARELKPEERAARWPEIVATAKSIDPKINIPDQPLDDRSLDILLYSFNDGTMRLDKRGKELGIDIQAQDLAKKTVEAEVAAATKLDNIAQEAATTDKLANEVVAGTPNAQGLTAAEVAAHEDRMLTDDIKEFNATVAPEQRTRDGLAKFLVEAENRRRPTNTVNVNSPQKTFENERDLRKDFESDPTVKAYGEVKAQVQRAKEAYKLAQDAEKSGGSASSSDQVIITVLNKVLDPQSVVRESEYARTADGQSLMNRLSGYLDKMKRGGAGISATERASIMETIGALEGAMEREYLPKAARARGLAKEYGLEPDRIAPKTPQGREGQIVTIGGKKIKITKDYGDGTFDGEPVEEGKK